MSIKIAKMLKFDDFSLLTSIFKPGWELQVLLYGVVFYLTYYAVYKIIFRAWAGHPRNYTYDEIWYWYRRVRFFSAVVFAPLFEEQYYPHLSVVLIGLTVFLLMDYLRGILIMNQN